jgi:hypothetical protein
VDRESFDMAREEVSAGSGMTGTSLIVTNSHL